VSVTEQGRRISRVARDLRPSGIREFFDLVVGMDDVISLGVGEPDFPTPWRACDAVIESLRHGATSYTSNRGMVELRVEIAEYLSQRFGVQYDPDEEILVTVGASEAVDLAMRVLLDPGDEFLVPDPAYVSYAPCVELAYGHAVAVPTHLEDEFRIKPGPLSDACSERTRGLLFCNPSNPTGAIMRREDLEAVAEVARDRDLLERLPAVHGAHLEGPFISPDRLGAQPPNAVHPSPELVAEALATGVVRVVTLAPEVEGAVEAAGAFAAAGTRVSVGHTVAGHADVAAVAAAVRSHGGTLGFTHLYNAMPGLGSREPGVVGAAFADASAFAEVILDLHHVHAVSFMAAVAAKPGRLHLITDAIRAAGSGDGASELGGQPVVVAGGAARLHDGTLAGSVLTLDRALRNAVSAGMRLRDALASTSAVPAAYLGVMDRGRIAVGTRADLVVLDASLAVTDVWVAGRPGE